MTEKQINELIEFGKNYSRNLLNEFQKLESGSPELNFFIKSLETKIELILIFLFQGCPSERRLHMFQHFQKTIAEIYEHVEADEE